MHCEENDSQMSNASKKPQKKNTSHLSEIKPYAVIKLYLSLSQHQPQPKRGLKGKVAPHIKCFRTVRTKNKQMQACSEHVRTCTHRGLSNLPALSLEKSIDE